MGGAPVSHSDSSIALEWRLVSVPTVNDISPAVGNPVAGRRLFAGGMGDLELSSAGSVPLGMAAEREHLEGPGFSVDVVSYYSGHRAASTRAS